jgi:glycosyltransferase involved in cell wall biosynthesis
LTWSPPEKVLLTGGHEVGGLQAFAEALLEGFADLGIPGLVVRPYSLSRHWSELRSQRVLKILSTEAILLVPLARRSICVAHSTLSARDLGWGNSLAKLLSYRLAKWRSSARLVAVSDYVAQHLNNVFDVRIDGIIQDPIGKFFLEKCSDNLEPRSCVTFVGRLVRCKNVDKLLPAICDLLDEYPNLQCCIVGDGPERLALEKIALGNSRIKFTGTRERDFVRAQLRRSRIFVSGAANEGFGITYVEALSQGCSVVMPASGGGLEIALGRIGSGVHLMPMSLERGAVLSALRAALHSSPAPFRIEEHTPRAVASAYLQMDRSFSTEAVLSAEAAEAQS